MVGVMMVETVVQHISMEVEAAVPVVEAQMLLILVLPLVVLVELVFNFLRRLEIQNLV
tara:strand:+ start:357 stop:530 length:174 start_codon:yes stop_codon:yes gene_type:complete